MPYVDASAQTTIAGLTKHASAFPPVLTHTNPTTPPDDMPTKQLPDSSQPAVSTTSADDIAANPSLLLKRKKRPPLITRISLPASDIGNEDPCSPPPTQAVLSPLPAANKLHAGHTPIFPRALSPLPAPEAEDSAPSTPEQEVEEVLQGPLTLPTQPSDGATDRIELKVLDAELEKIAQEQDTDGTGADDAARSTQNDANDGQNGREGSSEDARSTSTDDVEVFDGVILKKPRMNMGAPLGQA